MEKHMEKHMGKMCGESDAIRILNAALTLAGLPLGAPGAAGSDALVEIARVNGVTPVRMLLGGGERALSAADTTV